MLNITNHQGNANQNHSKTSPHTCHKESESRSVVYDSLRPHGLYPSGLLCPWDCPGKSTGVGLDPGIEPGSPASQANSLLFGPSGKVTCNNGYRQKDNK